jgi:hypothetical protein
VPALTFPATEEFLDAAIGVTFVAAIRKSDGTIVTSGNFAGSGPGVLGPPSDPPPSFSGMTFSSVSVGGGHGIAIDAQKKLRHWGGPGSSPPPHVANLEFIQVRARNSYCVAISEKRDLYAWGGTLFAPPAPAVPKNSAPAKVPPPHPLTGTDWEFTNGVWFHKGPFTAVACGGHPPGVSNGLPHVIALRPNGRVVGWGADANGQASKAPKPVKFTAIAAGVGFSVGLDSGGMLHHWGAAWAVPATSSSPPTPPPGPFMSIGAGVAHSSAVRFVV